MTRRKDDTSAANEGVAFLRGRTTDVDIDEPSDVTVLRRGDLFVVSDVESTGILMTREGESARVEIAGVGDEESGFEAVAYDAKRQRLFVVREERHELAILRWAGTAATSTELLEVRKLPSIGRTKGKSRKKSNKGIEGMAWLPSRHSPTGKAHLILAKEAKPRALVLLDADGKGEPWEIPLERSIDKACADFSGLAVDPISGHVFLCSDESSTIAEIALHGGREPHGDLVAVTELRDRRGKRFDRVEGIAIDEDGRLFVLQENKRVLWSYERVL